MAALLILTAGVGQGEDGLEPGDTQPSPAAGAPAHSEDDITYRDSVKQVLEDFQLSILESENLQRNSSAVFDALGASSLNLAENQTKPAAEGTHRPRLTCLPSYHATEGGGGEEAAAARVVLLNGTELQARLAEENSPSAANRTFPANCSLTLFYASWCPFRQVLIGSLLFTYLV